MAKGRVFKYGACQAVRLPKEFRINSREVEILRRGNEIVIKDDSSPMSRAFEILADLPDDMFPDGRKDTRPQPRKGFD